MEIMIYNSPRKYKIVAVKDYLIKNNIPITGIKLGLYLTLNSGIRKGGTANIEKHDELNMPIEEFNEILNDSQVFEIYIDEKHMENANKLFENFDVETFFNDCIYKSNNYDEAFAIYQLLHKNNMQCDDIFTITDIDTNTEEYLLFLDPEKKEDALKIINGENEENEVRAYEYQDIRPKEPFDEEYHERNIIKYIIPLVILLLLLLYFIKIDNDSILETIIKKIQTFIEEYIRR
jgi:hypothetical protein